MSAPVTTALLTLSLAGTLFYRGEFGYQLAALIALQLWLLWSLHAAWRRGSAIPLGGIGAALIFWWAWLALTLYRHPVPYTGRTTFWILGCMPLSFLAFVAAPDRDRLWSSGFGALAALCAGLAGWGAWQHAVVGIQPTSIFLDANSHAALLNLVALPLAGVFVAGDGPGERRRAALLAPVLALMVFSVATVQSRAASGALLLGIVPIFAAGARERFLGRPLRWLGLAAVCAGAFVAAELGPAHGRAASAFEQIANGVVRPDGFLADRRLLRTTSYAMLRDAPWVGVDAGGRGAGGAPRGGGGTDARWPPPATAPPPSALTRSWAAPSASRPKPRRRCSPAPTGVCCGSRPSARPPSTSGAPCSQWASTLVERTRRANPFRLDTLQLRASFVGFDPDLESGRKQEIWIDAQRRMLELDPRALHARLRLAGLLAGAGRAEESRQALEEGSAYAHGYGEADLEYRTALARARLGAGDLDGAAAAAREVDKILFDRSGQPPGFLERLQQQLRPD